jgi:SWI/SNF-related matrix-associated actin-dependent regulator 1 of chromatin subfamily A
MYDSILASHLKGKGKNKKAIEGNASDRQHLFTALRKTANHPLLLRNRHTSEEEIDHLANHLRMYGYFGHDTSLTVNLIKRQLEKMSDFDIHHAALDVIDENRRRQPEMAKYILDEKDLFCSPKLEKLRTLIPDLIEKGHRILIFSQWTNCLDLLGCLAESLSLSFLRLDGQTPIKERQEMINTFNKDSNIPIFLLSTKAGGMGINLTAADVCILHDLDFNPFNDLQAEDRCHRIGQTKPVKVIKMVTKDTVDDDIYEMQQRKTKMNAAILEKGGSIDAAKEKNWDNAEIKSILQNQLERYLSKQNDNQKEDTMTI